MVPQPELPDVSMRPTATWFDRASHLHHAMHLLAKMKMQSEKVEARQTAGCPIVRAAPIENLATSGPLYVGTIDTSATSCHAAPPSGMWHGRAVVP